MTTSREHDTKAEDLQLLNVRQVADLLGINARTVWRMAQTGDLPAPIHLGERVVRWRLADLRDHLNQMARSAKGGRR
jgi:excisionase family DNA binding protein